MGNRNYDQNDYVLEEGPKTTVSSSLSTFRPEGGSNGNSKARGGFGPDGDKILLDAISVQKDINMTSETV